MAKKKEWKKVHMGAIIIGKETLFIQDLSLNNGYIAFTAKGISQNAYTGNIEGVEVYDDDGLLVWSDPEFILWTRGVAEGDTLSLHFNLDPKKGMNTERWVLVR